MCTCVSESDPTECSRQTDGKGCCGLSSLSRLEVFSHSGKTAGSKVHPYPCLEGGGLRLQLFVRVLDDW